MRNHHQFKHLVLIEKERSAASGRIHTRDRAFNSIAELLEYFQQDNRTLEMPGDIDQAIRISRAIPNSSYVWWDNEQIKLIKNVCDVDILAIIIRFYPSFSRVLFFFWLNFPTHTHTHTFEHLYIYAL